MRNRTLKRYKEGIKEEHRHLREIDRSWPQLAGQLLALNVGANQYTCPTYSTKKCFIVAAAAGDITTTVNRGKWAGPMSSLLLLDVYENEESTQVWPHELEEDCLGMTSLMIAAFKSTPSSCHNFRRLSNLNFCLDLLVNPRIIFQARPVAHSIHNTYF